MTHHEVSDLIPGYAVDALEPEEAARVEAHLMSCGDCRSELAILREAAASLAAGVAQTAPPPELRDKVVRALEGQRRRMSSPWRGWILGPAVAAGLILLLGGTDVALQQRVAALNARLAAQTQALALLADPSARTVSLAGTASGTALLVYDPSSHVGVVVASGLPDPGRNHVYQLWLVAGQAPQSAGVFRPAPGQPAIVTVAADFNRFHAIAISVEPAPVGAPRPTTTPILTGVIPGSG
jgi:anti-sigma-K factor RskA